MGEDKKLFEQLKEIKSWEYILNYHESVVGFQKKNSSLSTEIRNKGNKLYTQKGHDEKTHTEILSLYTKSIALAVENSEEQALAYSNRSAMLMHLHKYKKSLLDISKAYKITQSMDLKKKLGLRKKNCLNQLENEDKNTDIKYIKNDFIRKPTHGPLNYKSFQSLVQAVLGQKISDEVAAKLDFIRSPEFLKITEKSNKLKPPILKSPNKMIPSFSDCITVKYNKKYGRHIVATRDIKPGEILSVETGIVFPPLEQMYSFCAYCLNFMWNGIPCPDCTYAVYCSENCKSKAWEEYHDIECLILPPLLSKAFSRPNLDHDLLTCRLFIKLVKAEGLKNIIEQAKAIDEDKNSHINGFLTNGILDPSKFKAYYNLFNFAEDEKKKEVDEFGSIATLILSKYTQILKNNIGPNFDESVASVEIKKLLIRFKTILYLNVSSVQDIYPVLNFLNDYNADKPSDKSLGMMITPCSSLINHSCLNNVFSIFCKNGRKIIFTEHPIKKNEQLFLSYGVNLQVPLKKRQMFLKESYHFTCVCEPCLDNWVVKDNDFDQRFLNNLSTYVKILKEFQEYTEKIKSKKIDHLSLAYSIKFIELAFKHLSNFNATFFFGEYINYMSKVLFKLYGNEINMPQKC